MKTTHEYRGYIFTVTSVPKAPAFVVTFPDFLDIITSGHSLTDAFHNACEALDLHLESLEKLGKHPSKAKHRLLVEEVKP